MFDFMRKTNKIEEDLCKEVFVIINGTTLGDTLLTNSLAQNIKHIYPNSKIVRITNPELYDAVKYQHCTDDVIVWDRRGSSKGFWGTLKFVKDFPYKNIYAAIPVFGSDRAVFLSILLRAKYILIDASSFICNLFKKSKYPILKNKLTRQEEFTNLLTGITHKKLINYPIEYNAPSTNLSKFELLQNLKGNYIVLAPVSSTVTKDIPFDVIEEIIKTFSDKKFVLCGVGNTIKSYSDKLKLKKYDNLIDLTNKTSIAETAEVLKNATASICVDTGTMHLSVAVKTPTVCVYNLGLNCWCPKKELYNVEIVTDGKNSQAIANGLEVLLAKIKDNAFSVGAI